MSVETSKSASSTATESPTFFSQRVTVPSETDSPRAGIEITVPVPLAAAGAATGAGAAATGAAGTTGAGVSTTGAATTGAATAGAATDAAPSAMIANSAPTATV